MGSIRMPGTGSEGSRSLETARRLAHEAIWLEKFRVTSPLQTEEQFADRLRVISHERLVESAGEGNDGRPIDRLDGA